MKCPPPELGKMNGGGVVIKGLLHPKKRGGAGIGFARHTKNTQTRVSWAYSHNARCVVESMDVRSTLKDTPPSS